MRTMWKRALKRKREEAARHNAAPPRQGPAGATPAGVNADYERKLAAHERPQDVPDPRTKGSGHGQKTADKWNQ